MAKLFVGRISARVTENELGNLFSKFGKVEHVHMKTGFAFIHFYSVKDAEEAMRNLDGYRLDEDRLVVEFSKDSLPGHGGVEEVVSDSRTPQRNEFRRQEPQHSPFEQRMREPAKRTEDDRPYYHREPERADSRGVYRQRDMLPPSSRSSGYEVRGSERVDRMERYPNREREPSARFSADSRGGHDDYYYEPERDIRHPHPYHFDERDDRYEQRSRPYVDSYVPSQGREYRHDEHRRNDGERQEEYHHEFQRYRPINTSSNERPRDHYYDKPSPQNSISRPFVCFKCGKPDHKAIECPERSVSRSYSRDRSLSPTTRSQQPRYNKNYRSLQPSREYQQTTDRPDYPGPLSYKDYPPTSSVHMMSNYGDPIGSGPAFSSKENSIEMPKKPERSPSPVASFLNDQ